MLHSIKEELTQFRASCYIFLLYKIIFKIKHILIIFSSSPESFQIISPPYTPKFKFFLKKKKQAKALKQPTSPKLRTQNKIPPKKDTTNKQANKHTNKNTAPNCNLIKAHINIQKNRWNLLCFAQLLLNTRPIWSS